MEEDGRPISQNRGRSPAGDLGDAPWNHRRLCLWVDAPDTRITRNTGSGFSGVPVHIHLHGGVESPDSKGFPDAVYLCNSVDGQETLQNNRNSGVDGNWFDHPPTRRNLPGWFPVELSRGVRTCFMGRDCAETMVTEAYPHPASRNEVHFVVQIDVCSLRTGLADSNTDRSPPF